MAPDFLNQILEYKKSLLVQKKAFFAALKQKLGKEKISRYKIFQKAISRPGQINLIAEIKKASPSQGLICQNFDVLKLAKTYTDHQAAALSVLTEDRFFLGKPDYIKRVSEKFFVPILTKDFIIDEVQIYETFTCGSSAVLLIVAILRDDQLQHLMEVAANLGMDCLVEVHDEAELKRAVNARAEIIGINHRNLHTFEVDLSVSERLVKLIPAGTTIVAESGISRHEEVMKLKDLGAHAVLIGETFIRSPDVGKKVREVMEGK